MSDYLVEWSIDVDEVDSPLEAAQLARWAQTNPGTIAKVFVVTSVDTGRKWLVDLNDGEVIEK